MFCSRSISVIFTLFLTVIEVPSTEASKLLLDYSDTEDQGGGSATVHSLFKCACEPLCEGGRDYCNTTSKCYTTKLSGSLEIQRGCVDEVKPVKVKCDFVKQGQSADGLQPGDYQCCAGELCNAKVGQDTKVILAPQNKDPMARATANVENLPHNGDPRQYRCACDPLCNNRPYCFTEGKCYITKDQQSGRIVRNCFMNQEQSDLNCMSRAGAGYFRCCRGDMCNQNLTVIELTPDGSTSHSSADLDPSQRTLLLGVVLVACVAAAIGFTALAFMLRRRCRLRQKELGLKQQAANCKLLEADALWREDFGDGMSSGSGRGQPHLVKQTVGKQVTMEKLIGKGRFGEVWRGKWRGEDVAVKTFSSREETSYKQECEMYNTILLRHDNILGFCAADTIGINSTTQHLLIMHYHRNGSLYDYLQSSDLDVEDMLILAHSASAGLAHLHEEILEGGGRRVKPAIAHRDIKSKNILVKDNGQCCIGDLGHAIRNDCLQEQRQEEEVKVKAKASTNLLCFKDPSRADSKESLPSETESKSLSEPIKLLVGTKRYMAPEVLSGDLNPDFFESFKRVDVYAFGLVLWEIAKRVRPYSDIYHPPFWDVVPHDPTLEDMRRVVVDRGLRPPIPNQWENDPLMNFISQMMRECWSQTPSARLTILRVKKNLYTQLRSMRESSPTAGEKKLARCASMGSSSSGLCKHTMENGGRMCGGVVGPGRGRVGYGYMLRSGGSTGCESSSGVSGVSGGISETYSGRV